MSLASEFVNKMRDAIGITRGETASEFPNNLDEMTPEHVLSAHRSLYAEVFDQIENHELLHKKKYEAGMNVGRDDVVDADRNAGAILSAFEDERHLGWRDNCWKEIEHSRHYATILSCEPSENGAFLAAIAAWIAVPGWLGTIGGPNSFSGFVIDSYEKKTLLKRVVKRKCALTIAQHRVIVLALIESQPKTQVENGYQIQDAHYANVPALAALAIEWAKANPGVNSDELLALYEAAGGDGTVDELALKLRPLVKSDKPAIFRILADLAEILVGHHEDLEGGVFGPYQSSSVNMFKGGYWLNGMQYEDDTCTENFTLCCAQYDGVISFHDIGVAALNADSYVMPSPIEIEAMAQYMLDLPKHPLSALLVNLVMRAAMLARVPGTSPAYVQLQDVADRLTEYGIDRVVRALCANRQAETTFELRWSEAAPKLFAQFETANGSAPNAKWLKTLQGLFADNMQNDLANLVVATVDSAFPEKRFGDNFDDRLKGLLWASVLCAPAAVAPALTRFARNFCFTSVPGSGIRHERLGNACLWALINMPDGAGVPFLARLLARVKFPKVKKRIEAALNEAAAKAGVSRGELDELSIPTHDLDSAGSAEIAVGDGAALVSITGSACVEIEWRAPGGKVVKSIPAALKAHKDEIKSVKARASEIEADLATQPQRLQRLWLDERRWPADIWRQRYVEHPLVGALSRRLIWNVHHDGARVAGIWVSGAMLDVAGHPLTLDGAEITLWHPIECSVEEVVGWRDRLGALAIAQPFKQAHREVYLVTDAERRTGVYSNRFAGHVVKQHQLMALARLNGWMVTHRIWADVPNDAPTHIVLPRQGLVAEFWTAGAGGDDPEVTDAQAYLYLTTDQLRFYKIADPAAAVVASAYGPARGEAVSIADVPPLALSEVMRHCDLFVGVASVANDPNWADGGQGAAHPNQWRQTIGAQYWQAQAFGDLGAMAETRRALLAALLPSLAIGKVARIIDGKFLRVEGKRRAYNIHLGSGNILMEPNDQYLCIVPASVTEKQRVALPFEGDGLLSIILSKAVMLAADDKITDATILSQIGR